MNWNKLKTFLIVLFSFINIFLIITMITQNNRETSIPDITVQDTIEILKKNDIAIDEGTIPQKTKNMGVFSLKTLEFDKKAKYFENEEFELKINQKAKDLDDIKDILSDNGIQYAEFLSDMEKGKAKAVENIDGYPIFNSHLDIDATGNATIIKGCWLEPSDNNGSHEKSNEAAQVTSILIDYISNPDRPYKAQTITEINFGYVTHPYIMEEQSKILTAVPCWQIKINDGSAFYYDSRNGEYIRN